MSLSKTFFILFFLTLYFSIMMAQNPDRDPKDGIGCGTSEAMKEYYLRNPQAKQEADEFNKKYLSFQKLSKTTDAAYIIPVVFHVFGTTFNGGKTVNDDIIIDALKRTNEDFQGLAPDYDDISALFDPIKQPLNIEFALARIDPDGNPTTGINYYDELAGFGNGSGYDTQIQQYAWDNYKYMNVYIMLDLYDDGVTNNSGVAWYPSTSMSDNNLARVVYNGSYLGDNTSENFRSVLTHEFGHWLNLAHTFDNGCSSPGDYVDDTPYTTVNSGTCNFTVEKCTGAGPANGENFMDYTDCYMMYTEGQVTRMIYALENHAARDTLWTVENLTATGILWDKGVLSWSSAIFHESMDNNGEIGDTINVTLSGDSLSQSSGLFSEGVHYTTANVPSGLSLSIEVINITQFRLSFSGSAINHTSADNISNMNVTFLDVAFESGEADSVLFSSKDFMINFDDPFAIKYYDISDITANAGSAWTYFYLQGLSTTVDYGAWYSNGELRFETYEKPMVCENSTLNISVLPLGAEIGSGNYWEAGGPYPDEHYIRTSTYTDWDGKTAYMGFKFSDDANNDYYGWFRISVNTSGTSYTLLDYAYNTTPGASILAGQKEIGDPIANANGPYFGFADSLIQFSSAGSIDADGSIVSYLWNFGDGTATSDLANPSHTYASIGVFDVTLTVTDNNDSTDTYYTTATITGTPPVAVANGPYFGNVDSLITFSSAGSYDPDGAIETYLWDFGDGATSDLENPAHVYTSAGNFVVSLTVTDNHSADSTNTTTANIVPNFITSESGINDTPGAANGPVSFSQSVDGAIGSASDIDWFYFEIESAGDITISVLSDTDKDLDWWLYEESDQANYIKRGYTRDNPEAHVFSASTGKYYLKIAGFNSITDGYTLTIYDGIASITLASGEKADFLDRNRVPAKFAMHPNFPNPFNPGTTIIFDIKDGSNVKLNVYNSLGQLVRKLVDNNYPSNYIGEAKWDGKDSRGNDVPSGVYFFQLIAGKEQAVQKAILMK